MHSDLTSSNGNAQKRDLVRELRIIGETLANLTYLAALEADQPERVRHYMKMADEIIDRMRNRLQLNENRHAPHLKTRLTRDWSGE
jgi:hypothetical protein